MKHILLFGFIIINGIFIKAQNIDSLKLEYSKAKEDTNKVNILVALCNKRNSFDDITRNKYAKKALDLSIKLAYQRGIMRSKMSLAATLSNLGKYSEAHKHLKEALTIYLKRPGEKLALASIYNEFGGLYYYKGDFGVALSYFLKSVSIYEEQKQTKYTASLLSNIANIYYQIHEDKQARDYTLKVIQIRKQLQDTLGVAGAISKLGHIYITLGEFEKALNCFRESLEYTDKQNNKSYSLYNLMGIAGAYREIENHTEALLYYKKSLEIAKLLNDEKNVIFCLKNIGHQLASLGKFNESEDLLKQSIDLSIKLGTRDITSDCYYDIAQVLEKKGDFKEAVKYYKFYIDLKDSILNEESSEQVNSLTAKYESEKKEKEIALLNADNIAKQKDKEILSAKVKEKNNLILATIITSLLLILSIVLFYSRQKLKSKNEKILFEKKEALLQVEKQKMENDLSHAKHLLDNYTQNLIDKSKAIEELHIEIEKLKGLKSTEIYNEKIDNLDDLSNSTILTNDDWEKFKDLFEQVYKGFFTRLRDKYANLTKAEIRLISLIKLNLDTKQMANMLGVSPNTITMTKYRLRKKINLTEKEDIDLIIQSL